MFSVDDGARPDAASAPDAFGWLETKGEEPGSLAAMADFLARMRGELDKQFQTFVTLRDNAMQRTNAEEVPEAEAKLARADMKAAVEALSVIVRTLEKVDQLQRQLARDKAELEAAPESREAYDTLFADVEAMIEARVEERLAARVEARMKAMAAAPPTGDLDRDPPGQARAGEGEGDPGS